MPPGSAATAAKPSPGASSDGTQSIQAPTSRPQKPGKPNTSAQTSRRDAQSVILAVGRDTTFASMAAL